MAIAKLSIDIEARLAGLQQGLDKAGRLAEQQSDRMSRAFQGARTAALAVSGALGGLFTVGAAAAFVRQTGEAADAITNLARVAGTSGSEFQRYAFAARTVGIEQEKLSDILKDVQDKVGDFLQTGAGPLADFFEKIAPRVGVTAEQFRNLGGADALQLYVNSLEKANLSQSELTFYLEAIASDAALLLPLLRDNGRAMGELGDKAERLGVVMNDRALEAAREFNRNLEELRDNATGAAREIAGPLIQALNDLFALRTRGQAKGGGFFAGLGDQLREDFVRARLTATQERLAEDRPGFERAQGILAQQPDSIRAKATVAAYRELEEAARGYRQELQEIVNASFPKSGVEGGRGSIIPPLIQSPVAAASSKAGKPDKPGKFKPTDFSDLGSGFGADVGFSAIDALDAAYKKQQDALEELQRAGREAFEATRTPAERLNIELARQQELLDALGPSYFDTYERATNAAQDAYEAATAVNTAIKDADKFAADLGLTFTSAFEDAIVAGKSLSDVMKGLEQDILRIITRRLVTEPLGNMLTNLIGGAIGGGTGGIFGGLLSGIFGSLFGGGGLQNIPVMAGEFGGLPSFDVGTDYVQRDMVAKIHKGERIVPAAENARSGGRSIVVNVSMPAGATRRTGQQFGAEIARQIAAANSRNN